MEAINWLKELLATAVATAALLAFVGFLLRTTISERIRRAVGHEYDTKLEHLRSDNQRVLEELRASQAERQAFRTLAMSLMTSTRSSTLDRRVAAMDQLWKSIHELKVNTPALIQVLDHVGWNTSRLMPAALNQLDQMDFLAALKPNMDSTAEVARLRPFLGDHVYSLYNALQAAIGRAVSTTISSLQQKQFRRWFEEKDTLALLKAVLSEDEFAQFEAQLTGQLDWLCRKIESRVVAEIQRELSGEPAAEQALLQAARVMDSANKMREDKGDTSAYLNQEQ